MAKALGVGGVFFRSPDPKALGQWYEKWLGVPLEPEWGGASFAPSALPPGACTVWSPFPADTKYFDPPGRAFMFNLVVDDLDGALRQVREGGCQPEGEIQEMEYGRFGWFIDPDGNKVELWELPAADSAAPPA